VGGSDVALGWAKVAVGGGDVVAVGDSEELHATVSMRKLMNNNAGTGTFRFKNIPPLLPDHERFGAPYIRIIR
jgi:hypothetical protein